MGGDEFVVVAPSLTSQAAVNALAEELLEMIRRPLSLPDMSVALTSSIGVAVYPQHGLDGDTLFKHADIALYQAKHAGRNRYRLFVDDMNVQQSEHVILEQSLRRAVDTDQIQLEYQPVVDLHTGLVTSFEALARWRHPQLGSVPPQRFIPVAERSKLIVPLGEQIVRLVILQLHDWQAAGLPLVPIAINVTARQLELAGFADQVRALAQQYAVDLKWLAFEVTASLWTQGHDEQLATLEQLRAAGAHIYMDECNTASLEVEELRTLPIDGIKLAARLIRPVDRAPDALKIITDTIARARKLQLMTVAEGVETAEQLEQLRQLGCRCGQGYYFSKPIAPLQCRSLLQQMGETRRLTDTVKARAFRIERARETAG
jgi:predicted signal transduction protein with EAL and GGDEF domain